MIQAQRIRIGDVRFTQEILAAGESVGTLTEAFVEPIHVLPEREASSPAAEFIENSGRIAMTTSA